MQTSSALVNLQYHQLAQPSQSTTSMGTMFSVQPKSSSIYNRSSGMGIAFGYSPSSTASSNSIILQSVPATTTFTQALVTNNCYVNSNVSISTIRNTSEAPSSGNILTPHGFTGYVLPNSNTVVVNGSSSASNFLQQSSDLSGQVLINRQQGTSSLPLTVIYLLLLLQHNLCSSTQVDCHHLFLVK